MGLFVLSPAGQHCSPAEDSKDIFCHALCSVLHASGIESKMCACLQEEEEEPESAEEIEAKQTKERAADEKAKGNVAYKARRFDDAIEHYNKAYELNDEDISSVTNKYAGNSLCLAACAQQRPIVHACSKTLKTGACRAVCMTSVSFDGQHAGILL